MVGNAHLVSKVFFPRLVLPLSTLFSTLVDFGVGLGLLMVLLPFYRIAPGIGILLLPVCLLLIVLLAAGIGLFSAALMVSYRDVQYVMPVLVGFLIYASPVGYSSANIPAHMQSAYFLNPLAGLIEACRWTLLNRGFVHWGAFMYGAVFAMCVFLGGAVSFKRMERKFADVI
jgi:lipopolysaccharide transport system permease protein